uniref:Cytochrome c oxidase subunit NDUFA4 n=1 Tax=Capra hircus TaxID=9925 RepID=A0A452DP31_CAPHI
MLCQIIGQAKKYSSLIPLFLFIGPGGTRTALYITCLALFSSVVRWDGKNNPDLWNQLGPNDQYKFNSVSVDYSKLKKVQTSK